jgi:hypothetical protein
LVATKSHDPNFSVGKCLPRIDCQVQQGNSSHI